MINDLQFPVGKTIKTTTILFVAFLVLVFVLGSLTSIAMSPEENGAVEAVQFIALALAAVVALLAFWQTDSSLLKVAALVLACITCAAFMRETQSCSPDQAIGFCLPRLTKRIVIAAAVVIAIAGAVIHRETLKAHFKGLLTLSTLWPAVFLLCLNFAGEALESADANYPILFGVDHGFQYIEEFSELFGVLLITTIAITFYKRSKRQSP